MVHAYPQQTPGLVEAYLEPYHLNFLENSERSKVIDNFSINCIIDIWRHPKFVSNLNWEQVAPKSGSLTSDFRILEGFCFNQPKIKFQVGPLFMNVKLGRKKKYTSDIANVLCNREGIDRQEFFKATTQLQQCLVNNCLVCYCFNTVLCLIFISQLDREFSKI